MPWPLSQDYNEALQNPQTSFGDPELRQGQVVVNALGIPQPCSGNFADVYAVECLATRRKWAVKCFTREVRGLRERYSEISSYLQQARLPFTVDFQYQEQGIRIAGRWYPILKMHWIEGLALNTFVRDVLDKPALLEKLSRVWVRMARRLGEAGLAHGDLQHGNILLVPDNGASALAVKLIDYDGMWVPALAKLPSFEFGHPAYQHPQRLRNGTYNAEVDRFALLAVYLALRALIAGGRQLWERYDTGDNLLFRQADFEAPAKSPLFADLLRMNQPEVHDLAVRLIDAARMPLEQTPHLADLVTGEKPANSSIRNRQSSKDSLGGTATTETRQPAAQARDATPLQNVETKKGTRDREGSVIPWIATGTVAAFAVVGGVLLWKSQATNTSEKSPLQPAMVQAPAPKDHEATSRERTSSPAQADKEGSSSLPETTKKNIPAAPKPTKPKNPPPSPKPSKPNEPPPSSTKPRPEPPPDEPSMVPPGKPPVPDEAVLTSTTEEIRDTYKADYASKDSAVLAVLAEKLFQRGLKTFETPPRRFVFLREASEVAARAGDLILSFRALDELGKSFDVELFSMKAATLQQAAKVARTLSASKAIVDTALALIVVAIQADEYDAAEHSIKAAVEAAYKSGIPYTEMQIQAKEIGRFKKSYLAIKPALTTLAAQPNDAEANRLVGTFLCFQKGDWQKGLPLLARGDDAKLRELAARDLAAPASADAQAALGDSWWQLGIREKEPAKANLRQRACYWYERALPDVVANVRVRLMKNIDAHYNVLPVMRNWDHLDVSQATVLLGYLHLPRGEKKIRTRAEYSGPIEITVIARTEKNNIRLRGGKGACVIFNWERKREELRVTRPDGQRPESGSLATASVTPLLPNTWYALRWVITEDGMAVSVNGETVFSESHRNDLSGRYPIHIHSVDSDVDVKVFKVRSLGRKIG